MPCLYGFVQVVERSRNVQQTNVRTGLRDFRIFKIEKSCPSFNPKNLVRILGAFRLRSMTNTARPLSEAEGRFGYAQRPIN